MRGIGKFIKISVYFLFIGGIILLIFPVRWFPSFYDVRYMGWAAIAGAAIIFFLPGLIFSTKTTGAASKKNEAALWLQSFLAFTFVGNALGDSGLYKLYQYGFQFDKVLHFFIPLLAVITIYLILVERWKIRLSYAAFVSFFAVIFFGFGWEVFEQLADLLLKTHISGVYGLNVSRDTRFDLSLDILGSAIGVVGSMYFWKYFTGVANIKKTNVIKIFALALFLTLVIGFYAAYMKM